jgi:NAD(P)-dependent dehydrogenase (short-subunit alcohol dehydrogenase family)/acyl dehydratase
MNEPRSLKATDLRIGLKADFERDITAEDVALFADLSGDHNPLHLDESYAVQTNYGARIVHGAFQVALASTMAGMYLPGRSVVVGSYQSRFPVPLLYPSRVRVTGEITAWSSESVTGILRVQIIELSHRAVTADIHVAFSLHEKRLQPASDAQQVVVSSTGKPVVIVTGAGGGIGGHLVSRLAADYQVLGIVRSLPDTKEISPNHWVKWVCTDLTSPHWEEALDSELGGQKVYAIVHAAWPGAPKGGLLDLDSDIVARQVEFGSLTTIRIAQFLNARAAACARLVVLGTTAATLKPILKYSAYSLGKAALEHAVRLLAPELARNNITVNSVTPSFIPVGINKAVISRQIVAETSSVPLGRLCSPDDVAAAVEFFLSPAASFITGQNLPLTGGQL